MAWLSTGTVDAKDRLTEPEGAFVRTDGAVIANSVSDLVDGTLDNPINLDEDGALHETPARTGTRADGTATGSDCSGWTSNEGSFVSTFGLPGETDESWTNEAVDTCGGLSTFYCFETRP